MRVLWDVSEVIFTKMPLIGANSTCIGYKFVVNNQAKVITFILVSLFLNLMIVQGSWILFPQLRRMEISDLPSRVISSKILILREPNNWNIVHPWPVGYSYLELKSP